MNEAKQKQKGNNVAHCLKCGSVFSALNVVFVATQMILMIDMYNTTKRHLLYNMTTLSSFFWSFPGKIGHEDVVLNGTKPRTLFYRIDLQGLEIPLQAFVANIICKSCAPSNTSGRTGTERLKTKMLFQGCSTVAKKYLRGLNLGVFHWFLSIF